MLYVRKLREQDPRRSIVVVERNPNHPALVELRDVYRALIVSGDVTSDDVLRRLRTERAHRVLLLTGDDFANLERGNLHFERLGDRNRTLFELDPHVAFEVVYRVVHELNREAVLGRVDERSCFEVNRDFGGIVPTAKVANRDDHQDEQDGDNEGRDHTLHGLRIESHRFQS